jgi:hypothetical protein
MRPEKRDTVSMQGMVYSNMLTINALVELMDEKGLIAQAELLARIKKLQAGMRTGKKREAQ